MIDLLRIDEYKRLVELKLARDNGHWRNVTRPIRTYRRGAF